MLGDYDMNLHFREHRSRCIFCAVADHVRVKQSLKNRKSIQKDGIGLHHWMTDDSDSDEVLGHGGYLNILRVGDAGGLAGAGVAFSWSVSFAM